MAKDARNYPVKEGDRVLLNINAFLRNRYEGRVVEILDGDEMRVRLKSGRVVTRYASQCYVVPV